MGVCIVTVRTLSASAGTAQSSERHRQEFERLKWQACQVFFKNVAPAAEQQNKPILFNGLWILKTLQPSNM
ncbi:hypothetical protein CU665_03960 [Pseudomonas syringae pv. actinidifoliorum]|nr:hypothetical protein [Pseudomonas syringae pv. actinidifoliorum]NAT37504.1 hypothetical protein [Pseudomonas syringae pv. actinidifoliorum]